MYEDAKVMALSAWHDVLVDPGIRMNAQEQYVELLRLADNFREKGIIDPDERKTLIEVATITYTRAVEGAGFQITGKEKPAWGARAERITRS
jgi:hypothetical protein